MRIVLLALWMILNCFARVTSGAERTAVVTSMQDFYNLRPEDAKTEIPVLIKGVALCYDLEWNQLYLHSGELTDYFNPTAFAARPRHGDLVELTGRTTLRDGRPFLTNLDLKVLGEGVLPPAKPLDLPQLSSDIGQWIETTGEVRVAETSLGRLSLLIRGQGQECLVHVMGGPPGTNDFMGLMDSRIRVRGINDSKVANGRLDAAVVLAAGLDEITRLSEPEINPRRVPVVSIGSLYNRELGSWTNNRVHLTGIVSSARPKEDLIVSDVTGMIRAKVIQATPVQREQRVDVWGFFTSTTTDTFLDDAYFEIAPPATPLSLALPQSGNLSVPTNLPSMLTRAAQIRKLTRKSAAERIPVRLRGVVTYADPEWQLGFIQDRSGGIFVTTPPPEIRVGQWVELTGRTDPGGYVPMIVEPEYRVLGITNMPFAIKADMEDLAAGHLDGQWIEMQGVVRRFIQNGNHVYLSLASPKGGFKALVPDGLNQELPARLIDTLVTIQGACGSEWNARGQLTGVTLHVPSFDYVQVLEQPPEDPFAIETIPIQSVAVFDPERLAGRRVKLRGAVTAGIPLRGFYLQDNSGGIRIYTQSTNEIKPGDFVEVLGFPALGGSSPHLEEAIVRMTPRGTPPQAVQRSAEQILLQGTNDCMLVEVNARLLQDVQMAASPRLVLQDGTIIFSAQMANPAFGRGIPALQAGSRVHLKGVCSMESGENGVPSSFRVILAQPEDLVLLESPPWWTVRHTIFLGGALAIAVLGAIAWAGSLRRTVRRQTESLAREKNLLATIIHHLPDIIFVKDRDGRFILSNRAHVKFHGLDPGRTVLGRTAADIVSPRTAQLFAETDRSVLRDGQIVMDQEELIADSTLRLRCLATTKVPLLDGDGNIIGLVGISRDITERKEAENRLHQLSAAVEQSPASIVIAGGTGDIEYANPEFCRATGYPLAELVGRDIRSLKSPENPQTGGGDSSWFTTASADWKGEVRSLRKDGGVLLEHAHISPIRNAEEHTVKMLGIFEDVTQRRELESQLRQAQKMDSVGRLAAGLAHDINNMLTVIQGHCGLLSSAAALREDGGDSLREILGATERMVNLTRQLLMFSRKQPTRLRSVELNELISNLVKMLQHLLGEQIELASIYGPNLPAIWADPAMIEQVIVNLVVNARDAMPSGGRLSIRTEYMVLDTASAARNRESRPGHFLALSVEDTGCGMDEATLQHVFEPFFTTKETGKGTGLGLASVYGIVKQHDGWIEVASTLQSGSRFTVFLPASHKTIAAPDEKNGKESPMARGDETILLVEDEPALRASVELILELCGYRVLSSESGDAALEVWMEHSAEIDLLLTDLVMPGKISGRQLAERLSSEKPDIKTIFTSGYSVDLAGETGLLRQGVNFLQKPYQPADLANLLRECLDRRPEPQQHFHGI